LSLVGWEDYEVREVDFECAKYGGDLFTDDRGGQVRWYVFLSGEPGEIKGLDLFVNPYPFGRCAAFVDPSVNGEELVERIWHDGGQPEQTPFEAVLSEYEEERETGREILKKLSPGRRIRVVVPCTGTPAGIWVETAYGSRFLESIRRSVR
jgi:hypothetical protein